MAPVVSLRVFLNTGVDDKILSWEVKASKTIYVQGPFVWEQFSENVQC